MTLKKKRYSLKATEFAQIEVGQRFMFHGDESSKNGLAYTAPWEKIKLYHDDDGAPVNARLAEMIPAYFGDDVIVQLILEEEGSDE
ncbi:hypothetical protein A3K34_00200 [candidate division WWE3 bacterium RIFOXYC1_FULL_40_10]|nr:MAG: hypothetical protein A3K58_00200 [candidate division WWE3 bacterium RIFOXYB1_FULL_40_22]OGC61314.1 MAG: hypothetical protein A3K37_00200 [candidate division WWE3 bacterium RIFOXYA1_FULL_40_11]OGC65697.1 MAG: hypothetical protein A3K34_00200 [candidate division WWE3 bacterium RIFOXYC1_FULL_40_10]OGC67743.1 MAG: hypothetical protein A2450_03010 [candidate division WWE3 bacterium RIFOXYC2_FULL_40_11]OGC70904.1 MAG: hypothetical protein A2602_03745 [candidate division WWE3 bacterium RIFOXYD